MAEREGVGSRPGSVIMRRALIWGVAAGAAFSVHAGVALLALRQPASLPAGAPAPPAVLIDLDALPAPPGAGAAPGAAESPSPPPEPTALAEAPIPTTPLALPAPLAAPDEPAAQEAATALPAPFAPPAPLPRPDSVARNAAAGANPPRPAEAMRENADPPTRKRPANPAQLGGAAAMAAARTDATGGASGKAASSEEYRGLVMAQLRRRMRYPPAELAAGVTGTAVLNLELDEDGRVRKVRLVKSSGNRNLDAAALTAARLASPLPRPPSALQDITAPLTFAVAD